MKKNVSIENEFHDIWMKMCECNPESVSQSHGSLMNEKF